DARAPRPRRAPARRGLDRRHRRRGAPPRQRDDRATDRRRAHVRVRDRRQRRRPGPRLRVGEMTAWLATILVLLPFAGALVLWLLPLPRLAAGSFALLVALVEVGFWINALTRMDFDRAAATPNFDQ